jgi:flagellar basal body P-ring formation protein FlgA
MKNTQRVLIVYFKAAGLMMTIVAQWTILSFSVAWAQTAPRIVVSEDSWIKGDKVYLKDVATIEGTPDQQKRLGMIHLAFAPSPGKDKTLHGSWIISKIRSDKWSPGDVVLKIPEYVRVRRTSQIIDEERLFRLYADFIAQKLEIQRDDYDILRFKVIGNGPIPEGDCDIEITNRKDGALMGYVRLSAVVRVNGERERRLILSGWIDRFEPVVCTLEPLERGAILTGDELCLEKHNIAKLPTNVLTSLETLVGMRLKRSVDAGTVLSASAVDVPPLIDKGDRVTIVVESFSIRVTALGVAKDKGSEGDYIRVENLMNNMEIVASVVDGSTVRVHF